MFLNVQYNVEQMSLLSKGTTEFRYSTNLLPVPPNAEVPTPYEFLHQDCVETLTLFPVYKKTHKKTTKNYYSETNITKDKVPRGMPTHNCPPVCSRNSYKHLSIFMTRGNFPGVNCRKICKRKKI